MPCVDSALGNHSGDFVDFRATADLKSSSALKSTKSPTSNTANLRIFGTQNIATPRIHFFILALAFCEKAGSLPFACAIDHQSYLRAKGCTTPLFH